LDRGFPLVLSPSSGSMGSRVDALVERGGTVARSGVRILTAHPKCTPACTPPT